MHTLREQTGLDITFAGIAKVFAEIAAFISSFFAGAKDFAAGFEKTAAYEADVA